MLTQRGAAGTVGNILHTVRSGLESADIQLLANTFTNLNAELERVNFDVTRLPPAALGQLSTPGFQAATTRFQAYSRTVCGIG